MKQIERHILPRLIERMDDQRAIIVLGPRRSGKTTLLNTLISKTDHRVLQLNGDEADIRQLFKDATSTQLKSLIGAHTLVVIDEAQRIENIGLALKLITDNLTSVKVIASGSSSFELSNRIKEPLTGRKWEFHLLPVSYAELVDDHGMLTEQRLLAERLIFGSYPEVVRSGRTLRESILLELADSYLFRDILSQGAIRKPDALVRLVQALALQVGSQVSHHELGQLTGLDNQTVEKYITVLEQAFVVFRLHSLSRNHRNELKKSRKVYFYDNGIRNAILRRFQPLEIRDDIGALWENYCVSERVKLNFNLGRSPNRYFWRTTQQAEIDYVEEISGWLHAFEFKWKPNRQMRPSETFTRSYPQHEFQSVTPTSYHDFLTKPQ